jgi:hypothetical protein
LTFEDFFMADLAMEPMKIVGFEGVFGSFFMICILLPIAYILPGPEGLGLHENTLDTLAMIKSSKGLQVRRTRHKAEQTCPDKHIAPVCRCAAARLPHGLRSAAWRSAVFLCMFCQPFSAA